MLEVIVEDVEGVPDDRPEVLSPLQQLSLKSGSSAHRRIDNSATMPTADWRKRRVGLTQLEDGWRPAVGLEPPLEEEGRDGHTPSPAAYEDLEDAELERRYEDEEEEEDEERWEELDRRRSREGSDDNGLAELSYTGGGGDTLSGGRRKEPRGALLSVDFGQRRAKSPVTVQVRLMKLPYEGSNNKMTMDIFVF
jgi:hypothetical protein